MHVHNERNFPQAKLDGEINARFLLNGHGNLYFLLHNNSVNTILFNVMKFKKTQWTKKKKDTGESVHKILSLGCKI